MQGSITVGRDDDRVFIKNNLAGVTLAFHWEGGLAFGQMMMHKARGVRTSARERAGQAFMSRVDEDIVVESMAGALLFQIPCENAREIGGGIVFQSHHIEAEDKAEEISDDHALLQRRGLKLGLAGNRHIQHMAEVKAIHDPGLRRYIPSSGNVRQYRVGLPGLTKGDPK